MPLRDATIATLILSTLLVSLIAPVLAATAGSMLSALLRAGLVADATLVTLLVLRHFWNAAAPDQPMTFVSVLQAYCTFAAVVVFAAGLVSLASSRWARHALAVAAAAVLILALASPLWVGGSIAATEGNTRAVVASAAIWVNPFYSVASSTMDSLGYVAHQEGAMYRLTLIGDYVPAPLCPWWMATAIYLPAGLVLLVVARVKCRRSNVD